MFALKIGPNQWDWLQSVTETVLFFRAVNCGLGHNWTARANTYLLHYADLDVLRGGILGEEIRHVPGPAV